MSSDQLLREQFGRTNAVLLDTLTKGTCEVDIVNSMLNQKLKSIRQGLADFGKPSATAKASMANTKKADGNNFQEIELGLAKKLSDMVQLDEIQALRIVEELALERDISDPITTDTISQGVSIYWRERRSLLSLLGSLINIRLDQTHQYYEAAAHALDSILAQSPTLATTLLEQWNSKRAEKVPDTFLKSPSYAELWINQNLTEQAELLANITLLYKSGHKHTLVSSKEILLSIFKSHFGMEQEYSSWFKKEAIAIWENVRILAVLLSIAVLDLNSIRADYTTPPRNDQPIFMSMEIVLAVNQALEAADNQPELGPFKLAWSGMLTACISDNKNITELQKRSLNQLWRAYVPQAQNELGVFRFMLSLLSSEMFDDAEPHTAHWKSILLEVFLAFQDLCPPEQSLDFSGMAACLGSIYKNQPNLCAEFWAVASGNGFGLHEVLEVARARFPVQFEPFMNLVTGLSEGGEESAINILKYLTELPTITVFVRRTPAVVQDIHPQTRHTLYRAVEPYSISHATSRQPIILPLGTEGHLVSGENETPVVQWKITMSAWTIFAAMMEDYKQMVDRDAQKSAEEVKQMEAVMKLYSVMLQFESTTAEILELYGDLGWSTTLIQTLFAVLTQSAEASHPPIDLLASCLNIVESLVATHSTDIWLLLKQCAVVPSVVTTTNQAKGSGRVQTTGLIQKVLSKRECVEGLYPVTLAYLDLVSTLLTNAQEFEVADAKDLRQVKVEVLYPSLAYLQNKVLTNHDGWHYKHIKDRFQIASKILSIFSDTLHDLPLMAEPAQQPGDMNLSTLASFLTRSFLFEGGKYLSAPLATIIGSGPDLSMMVSKSSRVIELGAVWTMVAEALRFVKLLLRHRKLAGTPLSFLEVYLVDRTVGKSNSAFINVLASYNNFSCGLDVAQHSVEVLTLLCALSSEWASRPSFVGYLGATDQARFLISTYVHRLSDDFQPPQYRIAIWSLLTIALTTQLGLATLFLTNQKIDAATGLFVPATSGISEASALMKALTVLNQSSTILASTSELLPHVLYFLDVLWQNAKDHHAIIQHLESDTAFWRDLGAILSLPERHTELELAQDWAHVAESYDGNATVQTLAACSVSAEQRSKAHALRIVALAIHLHAPVSGKVCPDWKHLPGGLQTYLAKLTEPSNLLEWNQNIPNIHYQFEGHDSLQAASQALSVPIDYMKLAVRRWDENLDTDHWPGQSYKLDLACAKFKLGPLGTRNESRFLRDLFQVNLNWTIVQSELQRLRAWRFFIEIANSSLGNSIWIRAPAGRNAASGHADPYYNAVLVLLDHIAVDTHGKVVLKAARHESCQMVRSIIENWTISNRSEKKNLGTHYPEWIAKIQDLLQSSDLSVLETITNPEIGPASFRPLFSTLLVCYRALHDAQVQSSLDQAVLTRLQTSILNIMPLICKCFVVLLELNIHQLGQHYANDLMVTLALLEEMCQPVWNPHPVLILPVLSQHDIFRSLLQIVMRSVATGKPEDRPVFFKGSLAFILTLANVPHFAQQLVDDGMMAMLMHNGLSPLLQQGSIKPLGEYDGERGAWHESWCMILAIVTSVLRVLPFNELFMQAILSFTQMYGPQLSAALETSIEGPVSTPKLEEIERVTMMFYELSKHQARLMDIGGGGALKAFFDRSLFILRHFTYFFQSPVLLSSVILPVERSEREDFVAPESLGLLRATSVSAATTEGATLQTSTLISSILMGRIEARMVTIVRNILAAVLNWTEPETILAKSKIEWPYGKTTVAPMARTPVYEPASAGTLFDLAEVASNSLKEWGNRLGGKSTSTLSMSTNGASTNGTSSSSASAATATAPTPSPQSIIAAASLTSPAAEASRTRMLGLLEDVLVVVTTQLGLYLYHPDLNGEVRRAIQGELSSELVTLLSGTANMLQRFDTIRDSERRENRLIKANTYDQIVSLRKNMIPVLKTFAETKIRFV